MAILRLLRLVAGSFPLGLVLQGLRPRERVARLETDNFLFVIVALVRK